jgi:hypothetical protein
MVAETVYEPAYTEEPLDEFRWIDRDHAQQRWCVKWVQDYEGGQLWFAREEWRSTEKLGDKNHG